jgi:ubiquitin C-terminal hydrolase
MNSDVENNDNYLLLKEWIDLKTILWSKKCVVSPNRFIHILHNVSSRKNISIFSDFTQNDASEFLLFLINTFHAGLPKLTYKKERNKYTGIDKLCYDHLESIIKEGEYSKIIEIFYGVKISILEHEERGVLSTKPETFFVIHLPIPDISDPTIEDCFDLFMQDEHLEGENGIINEKTQQKENVIKRTAVWEFPKILIIDFQRFKLYNLIARKRQNFISFGNTLDLTKYVVGKNKGKRYNYELYGISNHSGSVNGGHYTSCIKNMNGKWYNYNDTIVKEIDINEIFSSKAYCLFYRKI